MTSAIRYTKSDIANVALKLDELATALSPGEHAVLAGVLLGSAGAAGSPPGSADASSRPLSESFLAGFGALAAGRRA